MNSIEDRIRGAAEAVARTVPDGGAPPLHLPAQQGRAADSRGRRLRGTGAHRWLAPLAAATAVVAVVAVSTSALSGGSARTRSHRDRRSVTSNAAVGRNAAQRAELARIDRGAIDQFLTATGAQYTTGALFFGQIRALESDSTAICMAGYGLHVGRVTPAQAARGDYDLTQFPDLGQIARAGTLPSGVPTAAQRGGLQVLQREAGSVLQSRASTIRAAHISGIQTGDAFPQDRGLRPYPGRRSRDAAPVALVRGPVRLAQSAVRSARLDNQLIR